MYATSLINITKYKDKDQDQLYTAPSIIHLVIMLWVSEVKIMLKILKPKSVICIMSMTYNVFSSDPDQ